MLHGQDLIEKFRIAGLHPGIGLLLHMPISRAAIMSSRTVMMM